jgi:hypothetical protein
MVLTYGPEVCFRCPLLRPDADEDELREWAGHVREFGRGMTGSHAETDGAPKSAGGAYEGAAYEALLGRWGQASTGHMTVLVDCCGR